ncbi:hypothetical protein M758_1G182700 [Ceratodon purpureus]|nr:hypothetical protein M758_1G182700 [Ceratodon purpureus]
MGPASITLQRHSQTSSPIATLPSAICSASAHLCPLPCTALQGTIAPHLHPLRSSSPSLQLKGETSLLNSPPLSLLSLPQAAPSPIRNQTQSFHSLSEAGVGEEAWGNPEGVVESSVAFLVIYF